TRGDETLMAQLCPKTKMPVTLGCRIQLSGVPNACFIVVAKDDILNAYGGWTYEMVRRHEIAHCWNWPATHPGARSLDGRKKPPKLLRPNSATPSNGSAPPHARATT